MLSVTEISKVSKLSRKTVYNVFRGTASLKSVSKVKKAIYKITKKVVKSDELVKGKYSNNSLIKILCKNTEKAKKLKNNTTNSGICFFVSCLRSCDGHVDKNRYDSGFSVLL